MTESLVVDPARLKSAGTTIRDQVLPTAPAPISAAGSDPVSAAINVTMPIIESPVTDGLRDVQAALTNTGSKIVTAADRYAETDQLLGEHVSTVQFLAASAQQPAGDATEKSATAPASRQLGAETADKKTDPTGDKKPDKTPQPAAQTNLNQLSALTQAAQPLTQGMQSMMSSMQGMQGMGNTCASPAKLADDTKKDDTKSPDEPAAQLVDATTPDADGAASGKQGSGSAPVQAPTAGQPATAPTETGL
jgi:ESX secretion-associated protein EspJ